MGCLAPRAPSPNHPPKQHARITNRAGHRTVRNRAGTFQYQTAPAVQLPTAPASGAGAVSWFSKVIAYLQGEDYANSSHHY